MDLHHNLNFSDGVFRGMLQSPGPLDFPSRLLQLGNWLEHSSSLLARTVGSPTMGPERAPGLRKLILVFGLIKKTVRNGYEREHLCAKLKHVDLANCAHHQTHPLYCVYSCTRQEAHLVLWTKFFWISAVQPMIEAVFAGSNRPGAFQ